MRTLGHGGNCIQDTAQVLVDFLRRRELGQVAADMFLRSFEILRQRSSIELLSNGIEHGPDFRLQSL